MCGFVFASSSMGSETIVKKALDDTAFRGPDAQGLVRHNNYYFGHNRLKILDLSDHANQPFVSRSGRFVILFNGEIYNFKSLAKKHSIALSTSCDTELLVELFEKIGPSMLDELNGMFAIVIYDKKEDEYFVARDRLGIKPLFYLDSSKGVVFSSEISSIVSMLPSVELDEFALRQYRKMRSLFGDRTFYKGVYTFPAGHYSYKGKITQYWSLPEGEQPAPSAEELKELITDAINLRMLADVPVGSYLSGGLDSSIVAALAGDVHTWSVGQKHQNEFEWSTIVSEYISVNHHNVLVKAEEYQAALKLMVQKRKEPLSVPNEVLIYLMTQRVKEKNTVVLSGEGADELFFGYDQIFRWAYNNQWDLESFANYYSYSDIDDLEVVEDAVAPFVGKDAITTVARFFQIAHLHGLLRRLDFATMLCGVEARVPFVDHRLVERLAGVSFKYRMANDIVKARLKRVFSDILPDEIIHRKKEGFPVDLSNVLGREKGTYRDFFEVNLYLFGEN